MYLYLILKETVRPTYQPEKNPSLLYCTEKILHGVASFPFPSKCGLLALFALGWGSYAVAACLATPQALQY